MTSPGGGFNFNIGANLSGLISSLNQIPGLGLQAAQKLAQSFASVTPQINFSGIIGQLSQVNQAAQQIQDRGQIRISLISDGLSQANQEFKQLSQTASAIAGQRYSLQISTSAQTAQAEINSFRETLQRATQGQQVSLRIVGDSSQLRQVLRSLETEMKDAESRGVKIAVTLDTEAARREKERLDRELSKAVKVTLQLEGAQQSASELREFSTLARSLSGGPINVNFKVNAQNTAEVTRVRQQLQAMQAGDSATVNLRVNSEQGRRNVAALQQDIDQLRARSANIAVTLDTRQSQGLMASLLGGAARGFIGGSGIGGNLLVGAGGISSAAAAAPLAAAVAVQALTQAIGASVSAGIKYNAVLETQINTLEFYTGSTIKARAALAAFQQLAADTPATEAQALEAGTSFIRITSGDIERAKELTELTIALSGARPELGWERVHGAMQQLLSGDFEAFDDRMNVTEGQSRAIAAAGGEAAEVLKRQVAAAGGSLELLNKNRETFDTRVSNLTSSVSRINAAFTQSTFQAVSGGINEVGDSLNTNIGLWTSLAAKIGNVAVEAVNLQYKLLGLPDVRIVVRGMDQLLKTLEYFGLIEDEAKKAQEAAVSPRTPQQEALKANQDEQNATTNQIREQENALKAVQAALRANAAEASRVTLEYDKQLIVLNEQIKRLERPNFNLIRGQLEAQQQVNTGERTLIEARGDPQVRAEAEGTKAVLDVERELIQIRQRRGQISQEIARREEQIARGAREAALEVREAALERSREEVRGQQEVRQVAIERLRDEIRGHQEARQLALERLREEVRAHQEARQAALEGLREQVRAAQDARTVALEGLREQTRVAQDGRRQEIEDLRESVQARRDAYQEALAAVQEERQAREDAYQEEKRQRQEEHQDRADATRDRLEDLQETSRQASEASRRRIDQISREREALDQQLRQQDRARSLVRAERAVTGARTGRERADALERLGDLRADQDADRRREALQAKEAQERRRADQEERQRQEQIRRLTAAQRDEDRKFQRETAEENRRHQSEQAQLRQQEKQDTREEAARQRDENRQLKDLEQKDREQRRAEEAAIREREQADRAARRTEEDAIRALEQANRAAQKEDDARVREAEKADREATRAEEATVRAQERADREATRAENAAIRAEEQSLRDARRAEEAKQKEIGRKEDEAYLKDLREIAENEIKLLDARQRVLDQIDKQKLEQGTREKTLGQQMLDLANNAQAVDEVIKKLLTLDLRAEAADIEIKSAAAVVKLQLEARDLDAQIKGYEADISRLQGQLEGLKRAEPRLQFEAQESVQGGESPATADPSELPASLQGSIAAKLGLAVGKVITGLTSRALLSAEEAKAFWNHIFGLDTSVATDLSEEVIAGFTGPIKTDTSLEQSIQDWSERGILAGKNAWEIESPSGVTAQWAYFVAVGFIQQMDYQAPFIQQSVANAFSVALDVQQFGETGTNLAYTLANSFVQQMDFQAPFVGQSMRAPFEDFLNNWLPGIPPFFESAAVDSVAAFINAYSAASFDSVLRSPFEEFLYNWLPGVPDFFSSTAINATAAFLAGYEAANLGGILRAPFEYFLVEWLPGVPQFYTNSALASTEAWRSAYTQSPSLEEVLRAPFEEFLYRWLPGVAAHFKTAATDAAEAFKDGFTAAHIPEAIGREIDDALREVRERRPRFHSEGVTSAEEFADGFCSSLNLIECFIKQMEWMVNNARAYGTQVGAKFSGGFGETSGTGGAGGGPSQGRDNQVDQTTVGQINYAVASGEFPVRPGQRYIQVRLNDKWYESGVPNALFPGENDTQAEFYRRTNPTLISRIYEPGGPQHPQSTSGRQEGGGVEPGMAYWLHAQELFVPRQTGSVLPASVTRGIERLSELGRTPSSTTNHGGTVTVNLTQNITPGAGMDSEGLAARVAEMAVGAVIDVLDSVEKSTPSRVGRLVPGAVR